jgi:hypothetical protein
MKITKMPDELKRFDGPGDEDEQDNGNQSDETTNDTAAAGGE